jgi:hypothetical protein
MHPVYIPTKISLWWVPVVTSLKYILFSSGRCVFIGNNLRNLFQSGKIIAFRDTLPAVVQIARQKNT